MEQVNAAKYLMWQDVLTGLFDKNIETLPLNEHYEILAYKFKQAMVRNGTYNGLFCYYYHVAHVLALKAEAGLRLTKAYRENNRSALAEFANEVVPELQKRVKDLRKTHKENWFKMHKAFGWDVMDVRYGLLLMRLESAREEVHAYLEGELVRIEELEEERLYYNGKEGLPTYVVHYGKIVSASRIAAEA